MELVVSPNLSFIKYQIFKALDSNNNISHLHLWSINIVIILLCKTYCMLYVRTYMHAPYCYYYLRVQYLLLLCVFCILV